MSLFQVFECVEAALTKCGILDKYGGPLVGLEAIQPVADYDPQAWIELENALERQEIDAEAYQARALKLIADFCRFRNRQAVERKLRNLALDQKELGLIRPIPGACM